MSLDKAISHKKEHRKPYRNAKEIDPSCRNHGNDIWALNNRIYKYKKTEQKANDKIKEISERKLK